MTVALVCLTLESILLIMNLAFALYDMYRDWKEKKPKKKII